MLIKLRGHTIQLCDYFADVYDYSLFIGFLCTKLSIHFFPETGKLWVVVLRIECFVSCLTYSFPILNTCFETSGGVIVLFLPLPNCSRRFAEK